MIYRIEYRADGWRRPDAAVAEYQAMTQYQANGKRVSICLARFAGTNGPGRIVSAQVQAIVEDQWGRRRWREVQRLDAGELELVEIGA